MKDRDIEKLLREAPLVEAPESLGRGTREALGETERVSCEWFRWRIPGWIGIAIGVVGFAVGWRVGQSDSNEDVGIASRGTTPILVVREVVSGEPFTESREPDLNRFFASTQRFNVQ